MKPYYDEGGITIYHGDCRDVLPTLGPVDLVLTDPPYGVTYQSNMAVGQGTKPITNDGTRLSLVLNRQVIPLLNAGHVLWFTRWDAWPDIWAELGQHYPLRGLLVWDKGSPGMGDLKHWGPSYELIASAGAGQLHGARDGSVLRFNGVSSNGRLHPTQKPVPLLRYLIEQLRPSMVLDPFMGALGPRWPRPTSWAFPPSGSRSTRAIASVRCRGSRRRACSEKPRDAQAVAFL